MMEVSGVRKLVRDAGDELFLDRQRVDQVGDVAEGHDGSVEPAGIVLHGPGRAQHGPLVLAGADPHQDVRKCFSAYGTADRPISSGAKGVVRSASKTSRSDSSGFSRFPGAWPPSGPAAVARCSGCPARGVGDEDAHGDGVQDGIQPAHVHFALFQQGP